MTAFNGGLAETATFNGLENWNNNGTLTMQDQAVGSGNANFDTVAISGNFNGGAGNNLRIDTFLGAPGSGSDLLTVGGATTGVTQVSVFDVNGNGPGAFNPIGIAFATSTSGQTALGQFVLAPDSSFFDAGRGVLDKGLFFYDIATRPELGGGRSQVLIGVPDIEAFQLPRAISGAQTIWNESAGVWLDRQADLRRLLMPAPVGSSVVSKDTPRATTSQLAALGTGAITPALWRRRSAAGRTATLRRASRSSTGPTGSTWTTSRTLWRDRGR